MATTDCKNCGGTYHWYWEEAFSKFGFWDGDGQVETWRIEDALREVGYETTAEEWGFHNVVIVSIRKDGRELIPKDDIKIGYDNPRTYLPREIIALLDEVFPSEDIPDCLF